MRGPTDLVCLLPPSQSRSRTTGVYRVSHVHKDKGSFLPKTRLLCRSKKEKKNLPKTPKPCKRGHVKSFTIDYWQSSSRTASTRGRRNLSSRLRTRKHQTPGNALPDPTRKLLSVRTETPRKYIQRFSFTTYPCFYKKHERKQTKLNQTFLSLISFKY